MTDRRLIPTNSAKYKRARAAFYRRQGRWGWYALCGEVIDMLLSGRLANGRSIDHKVATSAGGAFFDESNWQLAHRRCNAAKGRGEALGDCSPGRCSGAR